MRKPSPSMAVAIVALVMASTGTGVAAAKYLITSSKQIKAGSISLSDLSQDARASLRGQRGATGSTGLQGPAGTAGSAGASGQPGAAGTPGATGTPGERGPSDAYFITSLGVANGVTLPVGKFVLTGDVYFGTGGTMVCTAWHQTGPGGASGKSSYANGGNTTWNLPVSDAFTMTSPGKAYVDCSGGGAFVVRPDVSVIQVGSLTP